jgi:hypothetical protein
MCLRRDSVRREGAPPGKRATVRASRRESAPPGKRAARRACRQGNAPPGDLVATGWARRRKGARCRLRPVRVLAWGTHQSGQKETWGGFCKISNMREQFNPDSSVGFFIKYSDRTKSVKFIWISSNLINLDQSVPDLQVVGLVLSILQVVRLNCSHGARCGTKIVYTSYILFTHINLSVRYYLCIEKWNKRPWQCTDIQLVFMQTMNSVLQRVIIQEDENWRLCQEI